MLIVLFVNLSGYSQSIIDFFETIPDSSIVNLTKEQRKKIVTYSLDDKTTGDAFNDLSNDPIDYTFDILDIKNGYLKLIGAFEGQIQMCYWNLTNGHKLISIYFEGCGPVCYIAQFDFYEYDGKDFKPVDRHSIIPDVYNDFLGIDFKEKIRELKNKDIIATLLFELPRNGKNIIAKWGNEDSQETYKKYAIGDRMGLTWKDGRFEKGKIFWK